MTPLKKLTKTAIVLFPLTLLFFLIHNTKQPSPNILIARDTFIPDDIPSYTHPNLTRRQDYTCGPGRPCSNGACCGASGSCGYGKTYCGDGCVSNCNAVAECGKDARPAGKKCPLNTCCSQYGFCGTTEVCLFLFSGMKRGIGEGADLSRNSAPKNTSVSRIACWTRSRRVALRRGRRRVKVLIPTYLHSMHIH